MKATSSHLDDYQSFKPVFEKLVRKGVKVFIVAKHLDELDEAMNVQLEARIYYFEVLGVQVSLCEGHHTKLAMIDRKNAPGR